MAHFVQKFSLANCYSDYPTFKGYSLLNTKISEQKRKSHIKYHDVCVAIYSLWPSSLMKDAKLILIIQLYGTEKQSIF